MAATAQVIWLCACVRYWPDRGLVFKCFTCFYCLKGVTFILDSVKCVPIPVNKQEDPSLWVAEN